MKAIKIILALVVTVVITFFVFKFIVNPPVAPLITPPINQFTDRIEQEVDSMQNSEHKTLYSVSEFYNDIQYRIDDYHKSMFFGSNQIDNDEWRDILSKNLCSSYAPKFVEQAYKVFRGTEWRRSDREYISREISSLQSSGHLTEGDVPTQLNDIQSILNKYNEIANFIWRCNQFTYTNYALSSSFPIKDIESNIKRANKYISNGLDNSYVKNSSYLNNGLDNIPNVFFEKHINYLNVKVDRNSEKYKDFENQIEYSNKTLRPLLVELNTLNNNTYNIDYNYFNQQFNLLLRKLNRIESDAIEYFKALDFLK